MVSILLPTNARGPILDLVLPASVEAVDVVVRNTTTGKSLTVHVPTGWAGDTLSLDFPGRSVADSSGADRSALLDAVDNSLWVADPLIAGANDVEVEAVGPVIEDAFDQAGGNLTGKATPSGKTYAAMAESDADDFTIDATTHRAKRGELAAADGGLGALHGRAVGFAVGANVEASIEAFLPSPLPLGIDIQFGLMARATDKNNYVLARYIPGLAAAEALSYFFVSGGVTTLGKQTEVEGKPAWAKLSLRVDAPLVAVTLETSKGTTKLEGEHALLAGMTGTHVELYENIAAAGIAPRYYDNLRVARLDPQAYAATATLRWLKAYY